MSQTYNQLKEYLKEIDHYRRVITLMEWDMYTATPPKGYDRMADTLTWFSTKEFVLSTAPELLEMLEKLSIPEEYDRLDEGMQYTVRTMLRDLKRQQRIPKDFFEEFTALQSRSQNAWREAKQSSDYSKFAPYLEKLICKTEEKYAFTDPDMDCYEAMLNDYEEGMDMAGIDRVFSELKEGLLPLLDEILAKRHAPSRIYEGTYDPDAQKKVQRLLLEYIGFSFDAGCCAETEHPFSLSFNRSDVRVTNHFREHDPIGPMFSAIHEGGHAIFSQNVSEKLMDTAADDCCGISI